jgi:leucyl aminopeptidase
MGLGKPPTDEKPSEQLGLKLGKAIAEKVNGEKKVATCSVILPGGLEQVSTVSDVASTFYATLYSDNRFRTGAKIKKAAEDLESLNLISETFLPANVEDVLEDGKKLAAGIFLTKDIVNSPHNILNSVSLADTAKRIAAESGGRIKCTILDKKECEKRGMGAYLGVARGSETEPQFIHLTYTPPKSKENKKVGVVGKGLLFDTGGYNIKTQMMELMKFDCGGAAAVLGAARAIGALAPEGVEAHFIVAACENMISSKAMVPSDILTASNGRTIEVGNTDAEGRLTLADALVYADEELGCESIIELSTLTGACMISLGKEVCGVWTSNDELARELEAISKVTGDKSWRMPLEASYNEQLESKIADIKNVGTKYGGAITAALFLQNFVAKRKPFAHIDIAGPVWSDKTGATGFGARMVTEWIKRQAQSKEE